MKKIYAILVLLTVSVAALAQSGRELYNKYSDTKGTEAVYISSAMFRMIGKLPDVEMNDEDVNFSKIVKSMSGFYILNVTAPATKSALQADVKKLIKSGKYELMMEAKEDGEIMRMYTAGDQKTVISFVMIAEEDDELDFICFDGKMDRAEMENLIAKAAQDD